MNYETLGMVLGALFLITGGLATIYKMLNGIRKEREEENQKVLKQAKDYSDQKFQVLEQELNHQRDIHEGKISELAQQIEQLREEMRRHHTQLVDLLSKAWSERE
jgi:hypothetical protein